MSDNREARFALSVLSHLRTKYKVVRRPFKHSLGIVDFVAEGDDEIVCLETKATLSVNAFQHAIGQALCAVVAIANNHKRTSGGKRVVAAISAPETPTYEQERAMRSLGVRFVGMNANTHTALESGCGALAGRHT